MLKRSCIMIFWNLTDNLTPFVLVWPFYCLWVASVASVPLARWQLSYLDRGKLYILGSGGWMCTSASLEHGQQASLLVTWAEVALLWGALVPVLLPAVLLATGTNMLMCKVGHGHFGVDRLDRAATGMSRRYLHGSLCLCFRKGAVEHHVCKRCYCDAFSLWKFCNLSKHGGVPQNGNLLQSGLAEDDRCPDHGVPKGFCCPDQVGRLDDKIELAE